MTLPLERTFTDPLDRLPPHSIDAEMCLLASMMLDRDVAGQILPIVDGESFYITDHRIMFE
ncbi:MAG TPA: DnaB-like helicase N-terminal domain-containing protein, partial [Tepidisphaeraceae bacterium]|nr:DnaB-like helicase N-terminal domain-containing protein [Tepidisphaeraceae bacterium]